MNANVKTCVALAAAFLLAVAGGCGKKSQDEQGGESEQTQSTAKPGQTEASLPTDAVPFGTAIEGAGFEVVYYHEFPSPVAGRKGRLILYQSATGGKDGGMVFVDQTGSDARWVWHWYFEDTKPERFERLDVNKDGLWDIRVYADADRRFDLVQDRDFLFADRGRDDKIALNGDSSEPAEGNPLWHCFDGNVRTAWRSKMEGGGRPYIEVTAPIGISDGILAIRAAEDNQPRECDVYADGKKVQSVELSATTDEQLVQLDPDVRTAKKIRLEIKSCHGDSDAAAVAELEIK
jgi:hypothetical protein